MWRLIKCFVELKSKISACTREGNHESKKAKGIEKHVAHDELKYEDYEGVLFN